MTAGESPHADGVADLADPVRLVPWLDARGLEPGEPISITPLSGGTSNVMFTVERGAGTWVLRRPDKGALERADAGMRREFRMLAALEGTGVPHPGVVALCDDNEVLGCTFFLMDRVDGVNPMPVPAALDDDEHRADITFAMVDALAALHDVDWQAAGLGDLGHPEQFHERQVSRWTAQLASYEGRELPGIELVAPWLEANLPAAFDPTIMHGDFHMLNALIAADPPARVAAIVDWETATIGDPLLDLAGFCEIWCSVATIGWPTRQEIIERYRIARGLATVPDLTYYDVLYNFRLATVLMEGSYQRSVRDPARDDLDDLGERVLGSMARAVELLTSAT